MLCLEYEMQTMTAKKSWKIAVCCGREKREKKGKLKPWMAEFNNNSALFFGFCFWKLYVVYFLC